MEAHAGASQLTDDADIRDVLLEVIEGRPDAAPIDG